jgi:hypothetical protein
MSSSAYVFYNNLLNHPTLNASSVAVGYYAQNATDGRTTTYWASGGAGVQFLDAFYDVPVLACALCLYRHNLRASVDRVVVECWDDDFNARQYPVDTMIFNDVMYIRFNPIYAKHWRIVFYCHAPLVVGVCQLGWDINLPFGMPVGFVPPRHNRKTDVINQRTESGQFVGRTVINRGSECDLIQNQVTPQWLRQYGEWFIRHAEKAPFFFSWSHYKYPQDAVFCMATKIDAQPYKDQMWQSLKMSLECLS